MKEAYNLELPRRKFMDLHLVFCGYEKCQPSHSYGPAIREDYLIHHIVKGKGSYYVNGHKYDLSAGQGFLIEPHVQTFYKADDKDPWHYLWIGFNGKRVKEYLNDVGLNHNQLTYSCEYTKELREIVIKMLKNNTFTTSNQFLLEGLLCSFFAVLSKHLNFAIMAKQDNNLYVQKALEYIHNNYANPIKITDIANYVCITRNYLFTLFKKSLNLSPHEYLTKYRIGRATEMLRFTNYSIESIALSCGYMDPIVFTKTFKLQKQITPSNFRKQYKQERVESLSDLE